MNELYIQEQQDRNVVLQETTPSFEEFQLLLSIEQL